MWELRLILILIGAVIVTGVYLWSRQTRHGGKSALRREAPSFAEDGFQPEQDAAPRKQTEQSGDAAKQAADGQLILALHVAARDTQGIAGALVLEALAATGLKYGRYRIFHRLLKGDAEQSVFNVANMLEPGALVPEELPDRTLPGLTLFLVLPGPQDGVAAYADMLATARHLAQQLDGEVQDETRSTLTRQTARHIRERIIEFQRRTQLRQRD